MIYKICITCKKEFSIKKPSEAKRNNRLCCSRSCATTNLNNNRYRDIAIEKICKGCGKKYVAKYARERRKTFCTAPCAVVWRNKNIGVGEEAKKRLAILCRLAFKGKKRSRLSVHQSAKKISGDKHWNWQGGKSGFNKLLRSNIEYKEWRTAVFERDNYTCQFCGIRGGVTLNADHIKPLSLYPNLACQVSNGRTLCVPCHKTTDTYGKNIKKINRGKAWGPYLREECK